MRGERQADAADYERRLAEAVDSAEKWKQFAEGLQVGRLVCWLVCRWAGGMSWSVPGMFLPMCLSAQPATQQRASCFRKSGCLEFLLTFGACRIPPAGPEGRVERAAGSSAG